MKIDNGTVAGFPAKAMRQFARDVNNYDPDFRAVARATVIRIGCEHLGVSEQAMAKLLPQFEREKIIERRLKGKDKYSKTWHGAPPHYRVGIAGSRLAAASLLKRIPRERAEKIVADLIARAKAINARPELMCYVARIRVFGSYLTKQPTLGDVDVAVHISRKWINMTGHQWAKWREARVEETAPDSVSRDWSRSLEWPEREVIGLIKNREPYLQMVRTTILDGLKTRKQVIFEASPHEVAGVRHELVYDPIEPKSEDEREWLARLIAQLGEEEGRARWIRGTTAQRDGSIKAIADVAKSYKMSKAKLTKLIKKDRVVEGYGPVRDLLVDTLSLDAHLWREEEKAAAREGAR